MTASVWMKSWYLSRSLGVKFRRRPVAETMPWLTEKSNWNGEPNAKTIWPLRTGSRWTAAGCSESRSSAAAPPRPSEGRSPTTWAISSLPSAKRTTTRAAFTTTWALVMT